MELKIGWNIEEKGVAKREMEKEYEVLEEPICIRTDLPLLSVQKFIILHQTNAHGRLQLWARVPEDKEEMILYRDWSNTDIFIYRKEEEKEPLFSGTIETLVCKKENRFLTIELRGVGGTIVLDREKKSQSFQNPNMTYKQVVHLIMQNEKSGNFIWMLGEDRAIETPLLQYQETDWEFLKRISSHFHGKLVSDLKTGKPDFFLGMCRGKRQEIEEAEIVGAGIPSTYYEEGGYRDGLPRSQVFCLEVRTKKHWQMGDTIVYGGRTYQVLERKMVYAFGEWNGTYRLGTKGVDYQERIYAKDLVGVKLEGMIRKCEEEVVYLQLDMDKEERADYPWSWTPETNNISYCMPEVGTKAVLYLPTKEEKDGQVRLAVVENIKREHYKNPQNREFFTKDQKKAGLYPERLFLEGKNGEEILSLEDAEGIRLWSEKNLWMKAAGTIQISGKMIQEAAPIELVYRTEESNLEICRDFNFYAPAGVKTVGTGEGRKEEGKEKKKEKKKEVEHWQVSYQAMGTLPMVELSALQGVKDIFDFFACGSVAKVGKGATTVALAEVMEGKKEEKTTFPSVFHSMENYTIKGGYPLPDEEELNSFKEKSKVDSEEEIIQEDVFALPNKYQEFPIGKRKKLDEIINFQILDGITDFQKLVYFIMELEDPFYDSNFVWEQMEGEEKKKVGIKPFLAGDNYITIGYGHSIQTQNDAKKYGLDIEFTYKDKKVNIWEENDNAIIKAYIEKQMSSYGTGLENPAILSMEEAEQLLIDDVRKYWCKAEDIVKNEGKDFKYNQIAALASVFYSGNDMTDKDSLSYKFLYENQEKAIDILKTALKEGWYAGSEGLFWRRLRECNIFYYDDYSKENYQNSPEGIKNLKEKIGWKEE